jgi:probable F420-dependent oxidoreductase
VGYLDELDAHPSPVVRGRRAIGALGPQMLRLAAERSWGAHPYLVPVAHTPFARETLGPDALLAPELTVVLEPDATKAREIVRPFIGRYMIAENYTNNLRRFGFGDEDFAGGGSDRLIDALVAWGDAEAIAARIEEHRVAGADHVCLQVITGADEARFPIEQYRELAR